MFLIFVFLFENFTKSIICSIIFQIISNFLIKIEGTRIEGENDSCENLNFAPLSRSNFAKNKMLFEIWNK